MNKPKKMLEVIIDRSKWLRGTGDGTLLRQLVGSSEENGKMCCLGFAGRAAGMTKKEIRNRGNISDCSRRPRALHGLYKYSGEHYDELEALLVGANDIKSVAGKVRERNITRLGKQANIKFSFVGRTK